MNSEKAENIKRRIFAARIADYDEMAGCTCEEIDLLQTNIQLRLPSSYVDFLLAVGHGAGKLFLGSDWTYDYLYKITTFAKLLLQENGNPFYLPEQAFPFLIHQGYQFMFFMVSPDDPPIHYYIETERSEKIIYPSFSDFLYQSIELNKGEWNIPE